MSAVLASMPTLQPRSPARPKLAGSSSTTTINTSKAAAGKHKSSSSSSSNRTRQRSNEEHTDGSLNMVSQASREDAIRRMTENFEDEVRLRRADLVRSIELARQQIIQKFDAITPALIDSLSEMTVKDFVEVHGCNLYAAHRAIKLGTLAEANDEINRTIKKRKRIATVGTDSANNTAATEDDAFHTGSPVKGRKNMRMAPPTPKMGGTASSTAFPRSASRPGLLASNASRAAAAPQHHGSAPTQITRVPAGSSRFPSTTNARASTSSNAGNFVYKARPSLTVPTNFNGPRLPQTPKAFSAGGAGSLGTARTVGKSTARRLPRKLESIQAYSMNGSPLGLFDLAVEQADPASHGSSDPIQASALQPSSQSGVEDDWEILSHKSTASTALPSISRQTSNTPLGKASPSKLGRKPSHSAFKDKILAGASKAFGGGSHMQNRFTSPTKQHTTSTQNAPPSATSSGYSLARPPTREEFTFQTTPALSSIPSQSNIADKWEAMKADLAKMCPDPEQRKLFEQRYLEIMHGST